MSYWITLVGGGGKTTTMFYLAKHYAKQGRSVIITTTTNIAKVLPGDFGVNAGILLLGETQPVKHRVQAMVRNARKHGSDQKHGHADEIVIVASCEKNGKFKGLSMEVCEHLDGLADIILVEGDGAKYLPIKVPLDHEPVIPKCTNTVYLCMGMDAISGNIANVCFRFERAMEIFGFSADHLLSEEDAADILTHKSGGRKNVNGANLHFVINKVDDEEKRKSAKSIKAHILKKMHAYGEICDAESVHLTSYLAGEYFCPISIHG